MVFLYNFSLALFSLLIKPASLFNHKIKAFVTGRQSVFRELETKVGVSKTPLIWVHCASLGEFEQGRPLIEAFKTGFPAYKILLTFFSPSGYEVRKNYDKADHVLYLPMDTPGNARKFVEITKPVLAIFIKYEFWYNYCHELKRQHIPLLSVSSIFRKDQIFFQPYGKFFRKILANFSHFFVQTDTSVKLLKSIGIDHCTQAGDTRFDRVYQVVKQAREIPVAKKFKGTEQVFVVGSCWPEDLDVLIPFINEKSYGLKFIIAPHEISESFIQQIEGSLQAKCIRYSQAEELNLDEYQVLIIDNIGMLASLYRYGEFAFVGGAFGKGLHNILEAACYGVPIFFGNRNYEKFAEANDLIMRGGAFEISDYPDLKAKYEMINVPQNFLLACEVTKHYVEENVGATEKIMNYCRQYLSA